MRSSCRRVVALVVAVVIGLPAFATPASAAEPVCTENSRDCIIETANLYLAALVSHDGSEVPLHEDAWRIENGGNSGSSGEAIRSSLESPIMYVITGIRELEWIVDGNDAFSFYLLDTVTSPTYIIERFRVIDGLIHEIEAIFSIDAPGYVVGPESVASRPEGVVNRFAEANHGPLGPVPVQDGNTGSTAVPPSSSGVEQAAQAYLDALVDGEVDAIPLADDAHATYNRRPVADSAEGVRAAVAGAGVTEISNERVWAEGDQAVAFLRVSTGSGSPLYAIRFHVVEGEILRVDTVTSEMSMG